jgi:hypothetical protein
LSEISGKEKSDTKGKIKENNAPYSSTSGETRFNPLESPMCVLPDAKAEEDLMLTLGKLPFFLFFLI